MEAKLNGMGVASISKRISFIGIGQLFNALINILLVPFLARAMETEDYGTYGQVLLVISLVEIVFSFGLSKLIFTYLNRKDIPQEKVLLNTIVASVLLGFVAILVIAALAIPISGFLNNNSINSYLGIYIFCIPFNLMVQVLISALNHLNLVKSISFLSIIHNLIRVAIILIAVQVFYSLSILFIGLFSLSVIYCFLLWQKIPFSFVKEKIDKSLILNLLKKGFPLSMSGVTTVLLVQTDGIMISNMLSTTDYAIYRMGAIPIPFLFIVYSSFITITLPEVTRLFHSKEHTVLLKLKRKASSMIAAISYPVLIFILIFSKDIVALYLGEKYLASTAVFVIYNFLLFLRINDYRDVLIADGKTKALLWSDLSIFILNIGLNYFLISQFGVNGAALASIVSYYLLSGTLLIISSRVLKTSFLSFFNFKALGLIIVVSSIWGFALFQIYQVFDNIWLMPIMLIAYYLLVYPICFKIKAIEIEHLIDYTDKIRILSPLKKALIWIK